MPVPPLAGKENLAGFRKEICPASNKESHMEKGPAQGGAS